MLREKERRALAYHPFQNHHTLEFTFLKHLGDYSYSFQGSLELIRIAVTVSLFC